MLRRCLRSSSHARIAPPLQLPPRRIHLARAVQFNGICMTPSSPADLHRAFAIKPRWAMRHAPEILDFAGSQHLLTPPKWCAALAHGIVTTHVHRAMDST